MIRSQSGIPFTKAHGCGNDFLIIGLKHASHDIAALTQAICKSHTGIGADGVEWIGAGDAGADLSARLINADGSEAEISGNGTRCVAAFWIDHHGGETVRVRTGAGTKVCRLVAHAERKFEFEMNMGAPALQGIVELGLLSGSLAGAKLSMGNPQFVCLVSDFLPHWRKLGAEIQAQKIFVGGTNVNFVRICGEHEIEARFFERGVGETQSSGTGSCASAVAAIAGGKVKSPVKVIAPGGAQQVRWDEGKSEVFLTGPAEIICQGEFFV